MTTVMVMQAVRHLAPPALVAAEAEVPATKCSRQVVVSCFVFCFDARYISFTPVEFIAGMFDSNRSIIEASYEDRR
jgi:hypothetical protein